MEPTGGLFVLRAVALALLFVLPLIAAIAMPFGQHRLYEHNTHATLPENGASFAIAIMVMIAVVWMWRGRLLRTVIMAPIAGGVGFVGGAIVVVNHLLASVDSNGAEILAIVCLLFTLIAGGVVFIVQWIVSVAERRKLEREDPVFPTARVVRD